MAASQLAAQDYLARLGMAGGGGPFSGMHADPLLAAASFEMLAAQQQAQMRKFFTSGRLDYRR